MVAVGEGVSSRRCYASPSFATPYHTTSPPQFLPLVLKASINPPALLIGSSKAGKGINRGFALPPVRILEDEEKLRAPRTAFSVRLRLTNGADRDDRSRGCSCCEMEGEERPEMAPGACERSRLDAGWGAGAGAAVVRVAAQSATRRRARMKRGVVGRRIAPRPRF